MKLQMNFGKSSLVHPNPIVTMYSLYSSFSLQLGETHTSVCFFVLCLKLPLNSLYTDRQNLNFVFSFCCFVCLFCLFVCFLEKCLYALKYSYHILCKWKYNLVKPASQMIPFSFDCNSALSSSSPALQHSQNPYLQHRISLISQ